MRGEAKWSGRRRVAFALGASAVLWTVILAPIALWSGR